MSKISRPTKGFGLNPFEGGLSYLGIFRRHLGRRLYIIFALALLATLTEGFGIALLLPLLATADVGMVDTVATPPALTAVLEFLGIDGSLLGILGLIGGAFLLKGIITFAYGGYGGYLQAQLMRDLKGNMFRACSQMNYSYYADRSTGHFVNVINTQISTFFTCFVAYRGFLVNAIKALVYLSVAMFLAWRFGLMAIAAGVLILVPFRFLNTYVRGLSRRVSKEMSTLNKFLVQALQAFKYLASTGQMQRLGDGVRSSVRKITSDQARTHIWQAFTGAISEPLSVFLILSIIAIQVTVLHQPLAPILVSILLFHRGMSSLMTVQTQWQQTMGTIGAVEMVEAEFEKLREMREVGGGRQIGPLNEDIVFDRVCFSYKKELGNVLSELSLRIPARNTIALVGESGAGKSTAVDLVTLMLKPDSGSIMIDGVDSREVDPASWRRQIGYVSQETVIFDDTVAANIAMSDPKAGQEDEFLSQVRDAALQAQLADFIEALPDGYLTKVGDRGVRLSGGQRQRLFIARELFRKPKLLILDEATSALDGESERAVQQSIDALHGNVTVILIAHRLATIKSANTVFVFSKGQIVEQGAFAELSADPGSKLSKMVELQSL